MSATVMPLRGERLARALLEHAHRELEDRAAVHLERGIALDRAAADVAGRVEDRRVAAVGVQVAGEDAGRVRGLEHDRARAVAEEHAGAAILPVEDAREDLGADHERAAMRARADEEVGGGERVDEARAHGLHVEGRAALHAELRLQQAGARRKHHVGRRGGDDDEVDVGGACGPPRRAPGGRRAARGRW